MTPTPQREQAPAATDKLLRNYAEALQSTAATPAAARAVAMQYTRKTRKQYKAARRLAAALARPAHANAAAEAVENYRQACRRMQAARLDLLHLAAAAVQAEIDRLQAPAPEEKDALIRHARAMAAQGAFRHQRARLARPADGKGGQA